VTSKIVLENLKNRPLRSLLSVLLIAIPMTLILCLVGMSHGMLEDAQNRARGVGADIIVRAPNANALSSAMAMSEGVVPALAKLPHVKLAIGVVSQAVQGFTLGASGVDLAQFEAMNGGFRLTEGTTFRQPDDVMIDQTYASEKGVHAGSHIELLNHQWRVCGVFEDGMLAHIVFPIRVLQDLSLNVGKVHQVYLKLDNPANTRAVIQDLASSENWSEYKAYSTAEFIAQYDVNNIPALRAFVWVVISIGVVIGFAVVCLSMYMAVLQRTREIGILKSMGGSKWFILRIIMAEAAMMGIGGSILGINPSFGASWLIRALVPASIQMVIAYDWWPIASAITLTGAGLGALYPGLAAAAHDPIEALAYE
jgi:putative ABC transport system permease protein